MFVRSAVVVDVPAAVVQRRLVDFVDSVAGNEAARDAVAAGQLLLAGPDALDAAWLEAAIETLPIRSHGKVVTIGMQWLASTPIEKSVVLDANIELEPATERTTRISLVGTYRPPPVSQVDHTEHSLLAKVADAVAGTFVERLARRVGHPAEGLPTVDASDG